MGDSYKEAVVHQRPQAIHNGIEVVQPGLEPVYAKLESAQKSDVTPTETTSRRRKWIALIAAALVAVVIALAVGLGVGLTRSSSSDSSSDATAAKPTQSAASQPITSVSTSTTSSPSSSTTTISGTSNASPTATTTYNKSHKYSCPGANNTEIQDVGNSAESSYVVFCDADIHAPNKKDLSSTVQGSFADCLGLCNSMNDYQDRTDVALTWNFEGTGQQTPGTCWCLAGTHKSVISNPGNMVAVLASEDLTVDL